MSNQEKPQDNNPQSKVSLAWEEKAFAARIKDLANQDDKAGRPAFASRLKTSIQDTPASEPTQEPASQSPHECGLWSRLCAFSSAKNLIPRTETLVIRRDTERSEQEDNFPALGISKIAWLMALLACVLSIQ
jgi:hypothetical protein